ncbi:hypothetical protein [Dyella sp.]
MSRTRRPLEMDDHLGQRALATALSSFVSETDRKFLLLYEGILI